MAGRSSDWGSWAIVGNTDSSSYIAGQFVSFPWKVTQSARQRLQQAQSVPSLWQDSRRDRFVCTPLVTHHFQRPECKCTRGAVRASWKRGGVSSHPVASADADNKQRPYITVTERVREYCIGWRFARNTVLRYTWWHMCQGTWENYRMRSFIVFLHAKYYSGCSNWGEGERQGL